ncbi:hypothetical protein DV096_19910 [Bradymonadaceae bacterium TMQ3]|nr:hypothetical protein DV096_19910 [Bradymonadaceae bacterium TMQ3]TXC67902.1 hypothetical protein FRC91_19685 [Bradymonadales bacterium TMQ1]
MVHLLKLLMVMGLLLFSSACLIVEEGHAWGGDGEVGCECDRDSDCFSGVCDDDVCAEAECSWSSDCNDDERCVNGRCRDSDSPYDDDTGSDAGPGDDGADTGDGGSDAGPGDDSDGGTDSGDDGSDSGDDADCPVDDEGQAGCGPLDGCVLNNECPFGSLCLDGRCQVTCTDDLHCPTSEVCQDGICQPDREGGDQCVYDEDCGEGRCINGFCLDRCESDAACGEGEYCRAGVCRPDHRPGPQCRVGADCNPDEDCVNARCRSACTCDEDCEIIGGAGDTCVEGYCVAAHESNPECTVSSDCADNSRCLDGLCVPF